MKVGTIRGRHDLLVEHYLLDSVEPGQAAYDAAFNAAREFVRVNSLQPGDTVEVYYTGLTEVTLGANDGFCETMINVNWFRFDAPSGMYVLLRSNRPTYGSV